ncbi:MAG: citrate transporter, partial [Lachnospiraceae bacterium]|nr:citrate transporter [Lachnospiraceae bacterium]
MVAQIIAIELFLIMFGLIISEKIERQWASLGCGLLMLIIVFGICMHSPQAIWNTINVKAFATKAFWIAQGEGEASAGVNWATIAFIFGMMIMV